MNEDWQKTNVPVSRCLIRLGSPICHLSSQHSCLNSIILLTFESNKIKRFLMSFEGSNFTRCCNLVTFLRCWSLVFFEVLGQKDLWKKWQLVTVKKSAWYGNYLIWAALSNYTNTLRRTPQRREDCYMDYTIKKKFRSCK